MKERLHLQSDKFTKTGLPIPLLSADKQQTLLEHKWNSKELEDVLRSGLQGTSLNSKIAWWLNTILGTLHSFCYDECKDGDISVYCVRTSRIIATSNIIAESLNLALVAAGVIAGILGDNDKVVKKSISRLDAGGIIEAIHRVVMNRSIQEEIRREFLEKELYNRFTSYEYSFLEEASDGEKGRL